MADLGDYITRLICDASKYTSGTGAAVSANKEFSGSCNTMIGSMNRQIATMERAGWTTHEFINANEKATKEVKEHTRELQLQVSALEGVARAKKFAADTMHAADAKLHASRQADYDEMFGARDWHHKIASQMLPPILTGDDAAKAREEERVRQLSPEQRPGLTSRGLHWEQERERAKAEAEKVERERKVLGRDYAAGSEMDFQARIKAASDAKEAAARAEREERARQEQPHRTRTAVGRDRQEAEDYARSQFDEEQRQRDRQARERSQQEDREFERNRARGVQLNVLQGDPAEEERQARLNSVREMHARNLDRRQRTGSLGFDEKNVSWDERQRFLREQQTLEREMDANHITKPVEQDLLRGGLKKSQQEEVNLRLERERIATLDRLRSTMESAEHVEAEYTLAKLRSSKASEADIQAAERRANDMLLKPLRERGASQGEIDQATAHINRTREINSQQQGRDNRKWAGVEGFRAVEDFVQGSAYGGLRGGLLAASNNISQMGAAFGAAGAMAGSAASALIVLGSNAYEAWRNADGAIDLARRRVDEYSSSISKTVALHGELREIQLKANARQDSQSGAEGNIRALKAQRDALEFTIKDRADDTAAKEMAMGIQGLTPEQVATASRQKAAQDRQLMINDILKWTPFKWVGGKETLPQSDAEQAAVNQLRLAPPGADDKGMNAKRHADAKQDQEDKVRLRDLTIGLNLAEKEFNRTRRESMEAVQRQIRLDHERFKLLQNHRKDRLDTMAAGEQEEFLQRRQQTKKEADINRRDTARKWVGDRTEDLLLSGMKTDKERDAYAAEKEYQESLRRSFAAQQEKLLTPEEREAMDKKSQEKRDRDIRLSKYGDLQAGGSSGFASADIKSAAGMNNVMQAIRYANQTDTITQLKKIGDISQDIATAAKNVEIVLKSKPPIPVFDSI